MEQRISKRIPISLEVRLIWIGVTYKAFITNISQNGLYVIALSGENDFTSHDGRILTVKFPVSSTQFLELQCKAVWSDLSELSSKKIGLEINDSPAEFKKFYKTFFYKIKKEMSHDAIAIVGMSCNYPGAHGLKSFWENILARRREFRLIPGQRLPIAEYYDPDPLAPDKTYATQAAVIDGFTFDWIKRGIPKTVVESSDIVHWLALEVALQACEDAGYGRENIPSDRTGVILGNTLTGEHSRSQNMRLRWPYVKRVLEASGSKMQLPPDIINELIKIMEVYYKSAFAPITEDTLAGNLSNTIAGRICNFLDLRGGGYTVDGACSSSLIAVATAATALSNGTLDLAVAGGVDISLDTFELIGFAKTNALTKGDMRVYDQRASGFIPGEGAGFVVLKRLEDARADRNYIYAVLRGWGISSDGKGGMTAPKAQTQAIAIRRAYGKAGYGLSKIDFVEGHGTGTVAGDKAELEGIAGAMDDTENDSLRSCGITSLKSLIGHTKAASGIGAFIKAALAVNRRVIPPTAGCKEPNTVFQEKARSVYPVIHGEIRSADGVMRAGISGMGFGGINCHVTIESAGEPAKHIEPSIGERELLASYQETEIFVMSAGSQQEMKGRIVYLKNLAKGISIGEMVDLSSHLTEELHPDKPFRTALIARSSEDLIDCLDQLERILSANDIPNGETMSSPQQNIWIGNSAARDRIGFIFPGQGSQQLNMGRRLLERYSWARDFRDNVESWLSEAGYKRISEYIYRPIERAFNRDQIGEWKRMLSESEIAQPAICMTSLLWIRYLDKLGIKPVVSGGHSLGELTAFYTAGAFDDKALLSFAAFRGRVTSAPDDNPGIMASFACDREKVEELLEGIRGYAVIANINSPEQTVISGERSAVEKAVESGSLLNIATRYLPVSNAFHSRYMMNAADRLYKFAYSSEVLSKTKIKLFSSLDGNEIRPGTNLRNHFALQVSHQVDFISLIGNMRRECDLLVEVGPGRVLYDLVRSITREGEAACLPVESSAEDERSLNVLLGCCFVNGVKINWVPLFEKRLVRPFVPASKRIFIDNPCEHPLALTDEEILHPAMDGQSNMIPPEVMDGNDGLFSLQQINFIRKLMQRELREAGTGSNPCTGGSVIEASATSQTAPDNFNQGNTSPSNGGSRDPEILLKLASDMTGFPESSISLNHRLLEDLNLDSIKAGRFAAKALKLYGAEGKLDPTTMSNRSLREIYDLIRNHIPSGQPAQESSEINQGEVILNTLKLNNADNWVRDFKIAFVEQTGTFPYSFEDIIATDSIGKRHYLIISDNVRDSLCSELQDILTQNGILATLMDYKSLSSCAVREYERYAYFIFLLPGEKNTGLPEKEQIFEMAARMHCIGKVITSMKMQIPKPTYAIVQFGKGGTAFLCSIHLENPAEKIRVLEFSRTGDAAGFMRKIVEEIHAKEVFIMAAFDSNFRRCVPLLELIEPDAFDERKIVWTGKDVVLVTGGARGITAECALAFAIKTGVKLAIVGSTVLIDKDEEIQKVLQRYRENGITFRYYACDISQKASVFDLKKRIEQDLGVITGVIHGAAVNRPRRVEQVSLNEAISEIAPKLLGAVNICDILKDNPPKLFAGFGSIIGITGMMGNAWYGFSNEILNLVLQQFKYSTRITEIITFAFSIWSEVGMGARMGSLAALSNMGIQSIPKSRGVEHFMQLMERDCGEDQVIVTSRMGNLDILRNRPGLKSQKARFLEEILFYEKGVEIEARAVLTLDKDPYLKDHVYKGTCLFPTVFGVEAMAQAVSSVMGISEFDSLQIENILLNYPITVDPDESTEIHIRALIQDKPDNRGEIRVNAGITVAQTGFLKNHFEAAFVFHVPKSVEKYYGNIPENILDIKPLEDLYGHMLFQGSLFQRIKAIRSLNDKQCIFDSEMEITSQNSETSDGKLIAGDPFFRDTLLQSVQIILPDLVALPVEIEKWEISRGSHVKGTHHVVVDLVQRGDDVITSDVTVIDTDGRIVEKLHGYKVKIVEKIQNAPQVNDLILPDDWDESYINNRLQYYCQKINETPPLIALKHQSGFHEMDKTGRHRIEKDLFRKAIQKLKISSEELSHDITIVWTNEGKPFVKESSGVSLSCSHDDRLCLCVAGRTRLGCDIETISHRSEEEWTELLGISRTPLLKTVAGLDKSIDMAGSRVWCALEALRKATDMKDSEVKYDRRMEDCLVFKGGDISILSFPIKLLRGGERMVAIATSEKETYTMEALRTGNAGGILEETNGKFVEGGPQGQMVFTYQFSLGLKDSSTIGGGVYFANYFHWLGKARERALKPIGRYIADEFFNGHFMVTNSTETEIYGYIGNHEMICVRVWIDEVFGTGNSSLLLHFEWSKLMTNGILRPVAFSRQQTSWIRTVGHGIVESVPCPEFFMDFLCRNNLLPKKERIESNNDLSGMRTISSAQLGRTYFEGNVLGQSDILKEIILDTTMEHSNLAQNIYFSNYFTWQGQLRDTYLFEFSPEQYRRMDKHGQFVCIESQVKHLREAMPFDRIAITMKLLKLYECGLSLFFEYFKVDPYGGRQKLAYGSQTLAWVQVDSSDMYVPHNLPEVFISQILRRKVSI